MMCQQVEQHIYLVRNSTRYKTGWYFSDESQQLNGPFETIEECRKVFKAYCEELNPPWPVDENAPKPRTALAEKANVWYRDLLKKYIAHVHECEGVSYIEYGDSYGYHGRRFTAGEWKLLEELEQEVNKERGR
jgi:hypothetical protein